MKSRTTLVLMPLIALSVLVPGLAQADDNVWVWRQLVVNGPLQRAELLLDNTRCDRPVSLLVRTIEPDGTTSHEVVHVIQGGAVAHPLPESSDVAFGIPRGLELEIEPGRCANALEVALAIVNQDDESTAAMSRIPAHTPEWTNSRTGDPGMTGSPSRGNASFRIPPMRIGPGQTGTFSFWNGCDRDTTVVIEFQMFGGEEEDFARLEVPIPPSAFAQEPIVVPADGDSVKITGFGSFIAKSRSAKTAACSPGLRPLTAAFTIADADGSSAHSTGLPTGKRQHKPVSSTRARDD